MARWVKFFNIEQNLSIDICFLCLDSKETSKNKNVTNSPANLNLINTIKFTPEHPTNINPENPTPQLEKFPTKEVELKECLNSDLRTSDYYGSSKNSPGTLFIKI